MARRCCSLHIKAHRIFLLCSFICGVITSAEGCRFKNGQPARGGGLAGEAGAQLAQQALRKRALVQQ
jgi:hypothetical protein